VQHNIHCDFVNLCNTVHAGDKFIAFFGELIFTLVFLLICHLFEFVLYDLMPFMSIMIIVFSFGNYALVCELVFFT